MERVHKAFRSANAPLRCCKVLLQVRRLAEKYFGSWQPSPAPLEPAPQPAPAAAAAAGAGAGAWWEAEPLPRPQPAGAGALQYRARARAGPAVMQAYYRPSARSEDSLVMEMVRWGSQPLSQPAS